MAERKIGLTEWNALEVFLYAQKKSLLEKLKENDPVRQFGEKVIDSITEKMHNLRLFGLSANDEKRASDITLERFSKNGYRER
jgi:hypothetical protein